MYFNHKFFFNTFIIEFYYGKRSKCFISNFKLKKKKKSAKVFV